MKAINQRHSNPSSVAQLQGFVGVVNVQSLFCNTGDHHSEQSISDKKNFIPFHNRSGNYFYFNINFILRQYIVLSDEHKMVYENLNSKIIMFKIHTQEKFSFVGNISKLCIEPMQTFFILIFIFLSAIKLVLFLCIMDNEKICIKLNITTKISFEDFFFNSE